MANKVFTGPGNFSDNTKWDSSTLPSAGDNLQITTGTCTLTANDATVYSTLTIDASITLDLATYNLTVGANTVGGTLKIGVSAGTGLTCAGLTISPGGKGDLQTTSKINNSSNFSAPNEAWMTNGNRGTYVQAGNGNYINPTITSPWYSFVQNAGVTTTLTGIAYFTSSSSARFEANGTIACGSYNFSIGIAAGGSVIFGASADITGSSVCNLFTNDGATYTNNKASAFAYTGTFALFHSNSFLPAWDYSNSAVQINGSTVERTKYVGAGTLKAKSFKYIQANNVVNTLDNTKYNPNFEISGEFDLKSGTYGGTYTKGTGTITLTGSSGSVNIDCDGKSVEDIVLNCSGATKALTANVTTDSLTITAGTLNDGGYTVTTAGNVSNAGTYTSTGTLSLTGTTGTQTVDLGASEIATLTVNCAGATKQFTADGEVGTFNHSAGNINWDEFKLTISDDCTLSNSSTYDNHGEFEFTGSGKVFSLGGHNRTFVAVDVQAGALVELQDGYFQATTLTVDGQLDLPVYSSCIKQGTIEGSGTLNSITGDLVTLCCSQDDFTGVGTLINVLISTGDDGTETNYGFFLGKSLVLHM